MHSLGALPRWPTICRYSVSVNTQGFHPCKEGSTPSSDANLLINNTMEPINKISSWMEKPSYKNTLQKFKEFYNKSKSKKDEKKPETEKEKEDNLIGWA